MEYHPFSNADGTMRGHICLANIYKFKGLVFEYHSYFGPIQYKKDLSEPRKNISRNFYDVIDQFVKLSNKEREKYLIYE